MIKVKAKAKVAASCAAVILSTSAAGATIDSKEDDSEDTLIEQLLDLVLPDRTEDITILSAVSTAGV